MLKITSLVGAWFLLGCFIATARCDVFAGDNFYVIWSNTGEVTDFYVTSSLSPDVNATDAWIAIGFSLNNETSNSNLVVCRYGPCNNQSVSQYLVSDDQASLLDEFNPTLGLNNPTVATYSNNLTCFFSRYNVLLIDGYIPVDYNNTFLFFSFGAGDFSWEQSNQTVSNDTANFPLNNDTNSSITWPTTTFMTTAMLTNVTAPSTSKPPQLVFQFIINIINSIINAIFG